MNIVEKYDKKIEQLRKEKDNALKKHYLPIVMEFIKILGDDIPEKRKEQIALFKDFKKYLDLKKDSVKVGENNE